MLLQLAKTTPYISGQQRIDVVLKKKRHDLTDASVHIVPLSDKVIYNENDKRPTMNYSHGENLKYLYEQTHQTFWNAVRERNDSLVYSEYPIDTYDHTYQRGLKRMRYSRYNKQFSFFCPLWIDTEWSNDFAFKVTLRTHNSQAILGQKYIKLSDEFKTYLAQYFAGNSDELLNINTEKNLATIKGCSMMSGDERIIDISYIITNILSRERPLMEFDSILCDAFRQNQLIAKQLLNLNFVFNFEDVLSPYIVGTLGAIQIDATVKAGILDSTTNQFTPFEFRDIYSNYDFIPAYSITTESFSTSNVFDYLDDNKCTDIIYNNKAVQPLCHWSLADNSDYLYNFYNGFSPIVGTSNVSSSTTNKIPLDSYKQVWGSYYGMPVFGYEHYREDLCNINWAQNDTDPATNNSIQADLGDYATKMTKVPIYSELTGDSFWMDWLKYDTEDVVNNLNLPNDFVFPEEVWFKFYLYDTVPIQITNGQELELTLNGSSTPITAVTAFGFIDTDHKKVKIGLLLPNSILDSLIIGRPNTFEFSPSSNVDPSQHDDVKNVCTVLDYIFTIRNYPIQPEKFIFDKGIVPVKADKSLTNSDEIKFIKANKNAYTYMYRYTGHLIPMFVRPDSPMKNTEWRPKQFHNVNDEVAQTINKSFIANKKRVYPSLGWFTVEKVFDDDVTNEYSTVPDFSHYGYSEIIVPEMCWFDVSYGLNLASSYTTTYTRNEGEPYLDDEVALRLLYECIFAGNPNMPSWDDQYFDEIKPLVIKNILNLYEYTFDFDYVSLDSIEQILYNIEYKLR